MTMPDPIILPAGHTTGRLLYAATEDDFRTALKKDKGLKCAVWGDLPQTLLADVPMPDKNPGVPVTLHLKGAGRFLDYAAKLPAIKRMNWSVFLPPTKPALTDIRLLSSLGIRTGILFWAAEPDWDAAIDLLCYSAYGKSPRAPIEPFAHVFTDYRESRDRLNWQSVYFRGGELAARPLPSVVGELTHCSACPGWRVCGGELCEHASGGGCRELAEALLEAAEHVNAKDNF